MAISEEQLERLARALGELPIDNLDDFMAKIKQNSGFLAAGNQLLNRQNRGLIDNRDVLKSLNEQYKKSETEAQRQEITEKKRSIERETLYTNGKASLINFTNVATGTALELTKGVGAALEQGTRDIMAGSSGFTVAGNFLKSMINLTVGVVTKITDAIGAAGQAIGSLGPIGAAVGLVMQGIAKAAGAVVAVMGQLAGIVLDITIKTIEDLTRSFMSAAKAGAVFGGGMTEIKSLASQAGLSIQTFSRLMSESGQALAASNLGVAEATKRVAATMGAGGRQLKERLFSLGYNLDEQAGIVADVMAQMSAAGDPFRASEPELIAATKEHAKNTRLLANYTGEDLKRKEQEAQKYKGYLAFQGKLLEMEPTARQKFLDKFNSLDQQTQQNYMDSIVFGGVINQTGATMMAYSQQYASQQNEIFSALNNQELGLQDLERLRAQTSQTLVKELAGDRTAQALQLLGSAFAQAFGEYNRTIGGRNVEALDKAITHTNNAATAMDGLTNTVARANTDVEKFRTGLEDLGIKMAPQVSGMLDKMLSLINMVAPYAEISFNAMTNIVSNLIPHFQRAVNIVIEGLEKLGEYLKDPEKAKKDAGNGAAWGAALLGAGAGARAGVAGGPLGIAIGGIVGMLGGYFLASGLAGGRAAGGPVLPGSSYLVGERGPELLKMSGSGTVTSNSQIMSGIDAERRSTAAANENIISIMREQLAINREMLAETRDVKDYMNDLRSSNQLIAIHTV